jgi:hypothetical protein
VIVVELLIPSDVEVAVVTELNARMPDRDFPGAWGTRIPNDRAERSEFGRVLAAGGSERDLVTDSPTVVIEAFSDREGRAQRMCAVAVAVVQAAVRGGALGGVTAYRARVMSLPQNLPMLSVPGRFRFTATLSVDLRRSSV